MQLIVAEKPAVARDLARVLGVRPSGEHCFEGPRHVITWCIGHLVELDEPAAYDTRWKAWRLDTLPMLPAEFRLRPSRHAAAQLRAVTRLLGDRRFTSVVNACDAGREGELIFRYVVQFAGRCPPAQRLWISSLTDDAIRHGFARLRPAGQFDPLADAARSRSEADWLVGLNATRALTVRARGQSVGESALYSIGRVQTPTLAMLVHREQAIRAFVPVPYWEVRGTFAAADGARFTASWRHGPAARLATAQLADAIVARDAAHGAAGDPAGPRVERVRARTVREPPPLLFDLTALQRTANRRFGLSAARTLEVAQALYERHKLVTYPRTDARHLSSDVARELPALFASLARVPAYAAFAGELVAHPPRPGRRVVDDAKVHDHHAIIPTGAPLPARALDRDEHRLFDLIARRFLAAFYPDAEFAVTEAWIRVGAADSSAPAPALPAPALPAPALPGPALPAPALPSNERGAAPADEVPMVDALPAMPDRYLARGRVRVAAGWQAVAGIEAPRSAEARRPAGPGAPSGAGDATDSDDEPAQPLPPLIEGQPLTGAFAQLAKQTTPPRRYTEATLLGAMESAGKAIDDEALRLAMKDRGLGTAATRASIIETLLARDYLTRASAELIPTPRGIAVIETIVEALPVAGLASPELTGAWEARLARIARGEDSRAAFMADIARYVTEIVDAIRAANPPVAPAMAQSAPGRAAPWRDRKDRRGARSQTARRPAARATTGRTPTRRRDRSEAPARRTRAVSPDRAGGTTTPPRDRTEVTAHRSGPVSPDRTAGTTTPPRDRTENTTRRTRPVSPDRAGGTTTPPRDRTKVTARRTRPVSPDRAGGTAAPRRDRTARRTRATSPDRTPGTTTPRRDRTTGRPPSAPREPASSSPLAPPVPPYERTRSPSPAAPRATAPSGAGSRTTPAPAALPALVCPRCRLGTLITGARGWGCARWREGCRFVVWFETAGRRLTPAQLRDLVVRGRTRKARFRSEQGELDGRLVLDLAADGGAHLEPA